MNIAKYFFTIVCFSFFFLYGAWLSNGQENRVSIKGVVEQIVIESTPTRYEYVLASHDGNRYRLSALHSLVEYANQQVAVTGFFDAKRLNVTGKIKAIEETQFVSAPAPTFGSRKVLILLVNFTNTVMPSLTVEQARSNVFTGANSANEYFKAASLNRFNLTGVQRSDGDVLGWMTIPFTNSDCENNLEDNWTKAADTIARDNGYEPNNYNSIIYVFPITCRSSATLGDLGGTNVQQRAWLRDTSFLDFRVIAHELGHNLGLRHADGYVCSGTNIPIDCQIVEYADIYSAMGNRSSFFFNNYHRYSLGWLTGRMQVVTESGDYDLVAPSIPAKGNQILQIPLKEASGFSSFSYFLEFRRPWSFDNQMPNNNYQSVYRGVGIRFASNLLGNKTYLIDTTPNTRGYFYDAPLTIGNTFTDTRYGVSITTLSTNPARGARVRIQLSR